MTPEELEKLRDVKIGIPFREFLGKVTNLITIFGVLNAILLFIPNINDKAVGEILSLCFWILSLMVWWEIIVMGMESNNESLKYSTFFFLSAVIEMALAWYFIKINLEFVAIAVANLVFMLAWGGLGVLCVRIFQKQIIKAGKKRARDLIFLAFVAAGIYLYLLMELLEAITAPQIEKMSPP
jgi:hypothetical protein